MGSIDILSQLEQMVGMIRKDLLVTHWEYLIEPILTSMIWLVLAWSI